jgi:hypothetical protein
MKRIFILIVAGLSCNPWLPAAATGYVATGPVQFVRTHETGNSIDWMALSGVTSLGGCQASDGFIVFRIKDDDRGRRQFAMAMAAKLAGNSLIAAVDDSEVDSGGYCYLRYLQIN